MNDKALIMIDYINDIIHPQGKIASCVNMIINNQIINKANHVLSIARQNKYLIIWVKVAFSNNYIALSDNSTIFKNAKNQQALIQDSWGTDFISDLNYNATEMIIIKNRINPFYATNLDLVLHTHNIQHIYVAGVSTEWAVEATARDAHDRNYTVSIIKDLCASSSQEAHDASFKTMQRIAKIINSEEF
jgi:nicotinamidase-related amidase